MGYIQSPQFFAYMLNQTGRLARSRLFARLTYPLMRFFAYVTLKVKGLRKPENVEGLAKEWQRMFSSRKVFPIKEVTEDTVYAEIHAKCPLRGTGDVHACYKMMEYDRAMVEKMGGEFVVLESQSNSGNPYCRVAMRMKGANMDDLEEAHLRD